MFGTEIVSIVQLIQEPKITFDLQKVRQVHDNYTINYHAGLTLVMGHPFNDLKFRKQIQVVQNAINQIFISYGLQDLLILYDIDSQVHATLIELASQHDSKKTDQQLLNEEELLISGKTNAIMNINYSINWIKKTSPFYIELGSNVLSKEHSKQTLRITDAGQIVMKGRAKERQFLAHIRAEFEKEANIVHKYGKEDDEFFFVIGYLKPDPRLNDCRFRILLEQSINNCRPHIQLALKVDSLKIIMYQNYSLDRESCVWESKEFKLLEEPDLPKKNLIDTLLQIINEKSRQLKSDNHTHLEIVNF